MTLPLSAAASYRPPRRANLHAVGSPREHEPIIEGVANALREDIERIARELAGLTIREEPYCAEVLSVGQLIENARANTLGILASISGQNGDVTAAPRRTGRMCVEHGVPLAAIQRIYRLSMSFVWDELVATLRTEPAHTRVLAELAATYWRTLDVSLDALASVYGHFEAEQIRHDAHLRDAALAALLDGTRSTLTMEGVAAALRLPTTGSFVVLATGRLPVGGETATALDRTLNASGCRLTWRSEEDGALALVVLGAGCSIDSAAEQIANLGLGRIGISKVFTTLAGASAAATQARKARRAASASRGVVLRYEHARVAVLLASEPEIAADLAADVLGGITELPGEEQRMLMGTLQAWFEADGSTSDAARRLHCHPNTVRYRMSKISRSTGLTPTAPVDAAHLYLAMEAWRVLDLPAGSAAH